MFKIFGLFLICLLPLSGFSAEYSMEFKDTEFEIRENWEEPESEPEKEGLTNFFYGFSLGRNQSYQVIESADLFGKTTIAKQKGDGLSFRGMIDYEFMPNFGFRGSLGVEEFRVSGNGILGRDFGRTKIMYGALDFLLKGQYALSRDLELYIQGGLGGFVPLSKESNSIVAGSISTTYVQIIGGGGVFPMNGWELLVGLDYRSFQNSESVRTQSYLLNFGFLFS